MNTNETATLARTNLWRDTFHHTVHPVAIRRVIALAMNMEMAFNIEPALPLLLHIIVTCGAERFCVLHLPSMAGSTGKPHSTLKKWLGKLEKTGVISKHPAGRDGVRVTLLEPRLLAAESECPDTSSQMIAEKIRAARTSVDSILDNVVRDIATARMERAA